MNHRPAAIPVRPIHAGDVPPLLAILNAIIAIGGTTAFETAMSEDDFARYFLADATFVACHVAEDPASGAPAGFQSIVRDATLPAGWIDIATFARPAPKLPGVGTALFAATAHVARNLGFTAINATIRADNRAGLRYYESVGFVSYDVRAAIPLRDGTPVDRIRKLYDLGTPA